MFSFIFNFFILKYRFNKIMKYKLVYLICFLIVLINCCVCPPVNPSSNDKKDEKNNADHSTNSTLENDPILSLEYHKYLREIVNVLETDPNFKQMIENASADDIKSGKIATHLDLVNHNVRSKLDELKRKEIDRLKQLIQRKIHLNNSMRMN